MAGSTLEFDAAGAMAVINEAARAMGNPQEMLLDIGSYLLARTEDRFVSQVSPDGTPWEALKPAYMRQKKKNKEKVLTFNGHFSRSFTYQVIDNELLVGTNRIYAAIHQFGGEIDIAARSQQAYFRQDGRTGEIGNRLVSRERSNFSQWVTLGAYRIQIPARPFLGVSKDEEYGVIAIAMKYLTRSLN